MSNYKSKTKTDKHLKEHYSFTTILLHIPVCVLVEKTITLQAVCFVVDCWQYGTNFPFPVTRDACCND